MCNTQVFVINKKENNIFIKYWNIYIQYYSMLELEICGDRINLSFDVV